MKKLQQISSTTVKGRSDSC